MNTTLKTILIVLAVIVSAAALLFAGYAFGRPVALPGAAIAPVYRGGSEYYGVGPGMMQAWQGPGMMQSWRRGGMGPGMMGNWLGGSAAGPGMMRRYGWGGVQAANVAPLSLDEARQAATKYIDDVGLPGLEVGEVMVFDNNAYVVVKETATGLGAFELLVDPVSKLAFPEHGPNMMWNLKYGAINHQNMMGRGGMMGTWQSQDSTPPDLALEMPVTATDASDAAQKFLDQYKSGAVVTAEPVQFYGYYTFDYELDGQVTGMLSVNGYSGEVFPHVWHGAFVEESE